MKGSSNMTPNKFLLPAALSAAAAALVATGAIGGALFTRQSDVAPAPVAVKTGLSVDETCVAVLSHGGRPQDCARMYLTSEYPGYGRDAGTELPGGIGNGGTEIPPVRPR
ncbi:MAG: hypothetical protein NTV19_01725 [Burkholderiales bacterium]|nr:hypothetical protein [Burkholderiales bacterium]